MGFIIFPLVIGNSMQVVVPLPDIMTLTLWFVCCNDQKENKLNSHHQLVAIKVMDRQR